MANLVDTSVNGDLRVTGTMFGTQAGNYATCATAAGTAAKAVSISGFTLTTGIHVFVKFTVTNTAAVASLTLNVSGTGAKSMKYRGGNLPAVGTLSASRVYEFIYDGTNWELVGDLDTNTQTVTGVKGNAESSYRTGNVNITAANVGAATSDHTHTTTLATDSGTATVTLAHNSTYKLTAGGTSVLFKTPADNNTDTKVTQTVSTSASNFPILAKNTTATATITDTSRFADGVTVTPSTKTINASYINAISDRAYTSYTVGASKASGDTRWMWVCRLKGVTNNSYNTVSLLFNNEFWNTQQANVFILNFAYGRNGGQGTTVSVSCDRVMLLTKNTDIEYRFLRNPSDTEADNTIDVYIRVSASGNSYGGWYAKVLNSNSQRISSIIEWKWQVNQTLPEGAEDIPLGGSVSYATKATQDSDGNDINETYLKSSGDVTLVSGTATKIGTQNGTDVKLTLPTIPAAAKNGALKLGLNGETASSIFTANQSGDSTLTFATGSSNGAISVAGTDVAVKGLGGAAYLNTGTASGTVATGNHTHTTSIASDSSSGTVVTLAHNTQYKLTAGGTSVLFKTPADNNTDTKVTQTADNSSTGTGFEVLFSATADNTTRTEASRKSSKLTFQPSTGTLTATKFSGPLTGNVTGNCSGSSGSCTGNAATATSATNVALTGSVKTTSTTNGDTIQFQAGSGTAGTVTIVNAKHAASADSATSASSASKVANKLTLKIKTGTTEGTNLYTYDGSAAKTLDIKQGSNITLTAGAGTLTIAGTADTKNTAGSTNTSSKIFLIGATSQAANPQTYSQDTTYVDTDATLASTKVRVAEKCTLQFNTTTNALDFVFA